MKEKMRELKIIAFAGLPLTGKSTLSKLLEDKLKIARLDIDEIRRLLFKHQLVDSEKDRGHDERQMGVSWASLFGLIDVLVGEGESVIVAATFSRLSYHRRIIEAAERFRVPLKIIFCYAPDEIIVGRAALRNPDSSSNVLIIDGYHRVKARYVKISVPDILNLDTSYSIEECLVKIKEWV